MKNSKNQSYEQKKDTADRSVSGSKQGMLGNDLGRGSMSSSSGASRHSESNKSDHGSPQGKSSIGSGSRSNSS